MTVSSWLFEGATTLILQTRKLKHKFKTLLKDTEGVCVKLSCKVSCLISTAFAPQIICINTIFGSTRWTFPN